MRYLDVSYTGHEDPRVAGDVAAAFHGNANGWQPNARANGGVVRATNAESDGRRVDGSVTGAIRNAPTAT